MIFILLYKLDYQRHQGYQKRIPRFVLYPLGMKTWIFSRVKNQNPDYTCHSGKHQSVFHLFNTSTCIPVILTGVFLLMYHVSCQNYRVPGTQTRTDVSYSSRDFHITNTSSAVPFNLPSSCLCRRSCGCRSSASFCKKPFCPCSDLAS